MRITERYPHESWRGPAPLWRTRRFRFTGPTERIITREKDGGPTKSNGRFTRVVRHIDRERAVFYRFTTTPNWAGIRAAQAGAAALFAERERGHGRRGR